MWRVRLFSHYLKNQIHHAFSVRVFSAAPCTCYSDRSFSNSSWQAQVICITSYSVVYSILVYCRIYLACTWSFVTRILDLYCVSCICCCTRYLVSYILHYLVLFVVLRKSCILCLGSWMIGYLVPRVSFRLCLEP